MARANQRERRSILGIVPAFISDERNEFDPNKDKCFPPDLQISDAYVY